MIDPFDLSEAPEGEPLNFSTDQSVQWQRCVNIDSALYTVRYKLRPYAPLADGVAAIDQDITMAVVSGTDWAVDLVPADMTDWVSGDFFWDLIVTRIADDRELIVDSGEIEIFTTTSERRSHAQIMVKKIESVLNNRADSDVESYSVKSRSITKMSVSDLRQWRDYYMREINNQPRQLGIFNDKPTNVNSIRVRLK